MPHRLLLVEDNEDALALLRWILIGQGYQIIVATDVRSAIRVGLDQSFDLLVCDINLPDGTGLDVLNALRGKKTFPALALTACSMMDDIEQQIEAGFDLHVSKPFLIDDLINNITHLLNISHLVN